MKMPRTPVKAWLNVTWVPKMVGDVGLGGYAGSPAARSLAGQEATGPGRCWCIAVVFVVEYFAQKCDRNSRPRGCVKEEHAARPDVCVGGGGRRRERERIEACLKGVDRRRRMERAEEELN